MKTNPPAKRNFQRGVMATPRSGRNDVGWPECRRSPRDSVRNPWRHAVQISAVLHGHAGDFHGNGWCGCGSKLPHARSLRRIRRTPESLCEESLHEIAKCPAQSQKRSLGSVPGDEAMRIRNRRQIRIHVDPRRTWQSRRRNVQRHEHCSALGVGGCRPIIERRILIPLPRQHHLKTLLLQRAPNFHRKTQHNLTLADSACAARPRVRPSMSRIEHNHAEPGMLNGCGRRRNCR